MIINGTTIVLSLLAIAVFVYVGLHFIRQFALQIAQENHDAVLAMDAQADAARRRKERAADQAAAAAFAKVQPILTTPAAVAVAASRSQEEEEEENKNQGVV